MHRNDWITEAITCPVRTETRAIDMVRKRSMMPSVMSMATLIAVPCTDATIAMSSMPGVR